PHDTELYADVPRTRLPIVYHPGYNITFLGIEKLHPFDGPEDSPLDQEVGQEHDGRHLRDARHDGRPLWGEGGEERESVTRTRRHVFSGRHAEAHDKKKWLASLLSSSAMGNTTQQRQQHQQQQQQGHLFRYTCHPDLGSRAVLDAGDE
ncbi:hypothetical protein CRUP_012533, partial [Coryphaenoides rupestris]